MFCRTNNLGTEQRPGDRAETWGQSRDLGTEQRPGDTAETWSQVPGLPQELRHQGWGEVEQLASSGASRSQASVIHLERDTSSEVFPRALREIMRALENSELLMIPNPYLLTDSVF